MLCLDSSQGFQFSDRDNQKVKQTKNEGNKEANNQTNKEGGRHELWEQTTEVYGTAPGCLPVWPNV